MQESTKRKWTQLFNRKYKENNDFNMNNKREAPKEGLFKQIQRWEAHDSGPEKDILGRGKIAKFQ